MKHNTYLIMLLGGIAMLTMGLASVLNISWVITSEYRGTEIGELIRKTQIQFYIPLGILAFAIYFGIPYISKKMLLVLCGLIFFLIVLNYYWGRKLTRQIRQLEAEQEMPPVLMTDTERERNSRSYVKAMLILLAGIVVSVGYILYNPVFPLDEQGYGWAEIVSFEQPDVAVELYREETEPLAAMMNELEKEKTEEYPSGKIEDVHYQVILRPFMYSTDNDIIMRLWKESHLLEVIHDEVFKDIQYYTLNDADYEKLVLFLEKVMAENMENQKCFT
ncbi:MAG: hypothetical protein IKU46_09640 [Peptococcaceae bacterium]|nr:hypothetical protein [Peptococcaceae bacterium]